MGRKPIELQGSYQWLWMPQGRDGIWEEAAGGHGGLKVRTGLLLPFGRGYMAGILHKLCLSKKTGSQFKFFHHFAAFSYVSIAEQNRNANWFGFFPKGSTWMFTATGTLTEGFCLEIWDPVNGSCWFSLGLVDDHTFQGKRNVSSKRAKNLVFHNIFFYGKRLSHFEPNYWENSS